MLHCSPKLSSFAGGWLGCSTIVSFTRRLTMWHRCPLFGLLGAAGKGQLPSTVRGVFVPKGMSCR